jgi:hypothetical protein
MNSSEVPLVHDCDSTECAVYWWQNDVTPDAR